MNLVSNITFNVAKVTVKVKVLNGFRGFVSLALTGQFLKFWCFGNGGCLENCEFCIGGWHARFYIACSESLIFQHWIFQTTRYTKQNYLVRSHSLRIAPFNQNL